MIIDVLTLFPSMFDNFLNTSIIKRAIDKEKVVINIIDFRKYSNNKHNKVDDVSFGGGAGMILKCEPIFNALDDIKKEDSFVILTTPKGKVYKQEIAKELSQKKHLIIICGHYEGYDERIRSTVDCEISVGDYILTGGEIPSLIIMDSVIRLLDDVISKSSLESESFNDNLLDYPVYTKPRIYRKMEVPEVLLSGDHKKIDEYRAKESIRITKERRSDLL
ncbi:MAG: tRNA (guanosine(37)-N1)-methyltransferase TrmD [Bacilli bacterium]